MNRTVSGILMILILALPSAGAYVLLSVKKQLIRQEVMALLDAGIDRDKMQLLRFSHAETHSLLTWKHDREFGYQGVIYDIVEMEFTPDSVFLWCRPDYDESEICAGLERILQLPFQQDRTSDWYPHVLSVMKTWSCTGPEILPSDMRGLLSGPPDYQNIARPLEIPLPPIPPPRIAIS